MKKLIFANFFIFAVTSGITAQNPNYSKSSDSITLGECSVILNTGEPYRVYSNSTDAMEFMTAHMYEEDNIYGVVYNKDLYVATKLDSNAYNPTISMIIYDHQQPVSVPGKYLNIDSVYVIVNAADWIDRCYTRFRWKYDGEAYFKKWEWHGEKVYKLPFYWRDKKAWDYVVKKWQSQMGIR